MYFCLARKGFRSIEVFPFPESPNWAKLNFVVMLIGDIFGAGGDALLIGMIVL
jgi:hypothetical protein